MKCNKCGSEIKNEALDHCLCCGERIERKSCVKLSTLFFGGEFGLHRFVSGRPISGMIMYILGVTIFILGNFTGALSNLITTLGSTTLIVWMIVDFILIINNKFYEIKPLKKPKKYKSVALILTILLGWTGIHKVYLKKYYSGITMAGVSYSISYLIIGNETGIWANVCALLMFILLIWILVDFVLICINFYKVD
ncbi:NINE protein [Clostridium thermobutyricum]|uniref:NINE protein n=2 Tax=Clostridium TaxID=1485 RepID=UPI002942F7E3|nr:NINE protein [Clostridium thermobutyricum]